MTPSRPRACRMTTWGPSKKQTAKSRTSGSATRGSRQRQGVARSSGSARSTGSHAVHRLGSRGSSRQGSGRSATSSATPPNGSSRREQATDELRGAVEGREHEFIGIGLIAGGVLLGLAIYLNLAGPLGRGIETLIGWLVGLGRYAIPVVLVAAGVAFVRKGQSSSPLRLAIGWTLVGLAVVGICHVANGTDDIGDLDGLGRSGGLVGALVGGPLRGAAGAGRRRSSCCSLVGIGGALLITSTSVKTMATRTGRGRRPGRPARSCRAGRQALRDLSSLSSDRQDDDDAGDARRRCHHRHDAGPGAAAADGLRRRPTTSTRSPPSRPARRLAQARGARRARPRPARGRARRASGRCRRSRSSTAPAPRPSTGPRSRRGAGCSRSRSASTASTRRSSA